MLLSHFNYSLLYQIGKQCKIGFEQCRYPSKLCLKPFFLSNLDKKFNELVQVTILLSLSWTCRILLYVFMMISDIY